ncbi:MAG: helix-turn-helix domain-containing protein [Treponema sp.]|jgi:AraC family transcriptional regulator of adaptative response / methylphosphotriester-DNA alkyltransferase methyltransferase|nr:helix-turn-helix domain-containing protein [Treponema sp.]
MTDDQKWQAVLKNDERYDGLFFYGVKSTKIFCRPSCKSKPPLKKNVLYFETAKQAEHSGHRPCKRCRPDLLEYQPIKDIAGKVKLLLDNYFIHQKELTKRIGQIGLTHHRLVNIFKKYYNVTPKKYCDGLRLEEAKKKLITTNDTIIDIAYSAGFQSLSAFYSFFRKNMNVSPSKYRKEKNHGIYSKNQVPGWDAYRIK